MMPLPPEKMPTENIRCNQVFSVIFPIETTLWMFVSQFSKMVKIPTSFAEKIARNVHVNQAQVVVSTDL